MHYLSIIIPLLNESLGLTERLNALIPLIDSGHEVIVVDGGSEDDTLTICKKFPITVLTSKSGRSTQMNHGASNASNEILVFLHIDTTLPINAATIITHSLQQQNFKWGHFKVRLDGTNYKLRVIEFFMNVRSCLTGIVTGDQTLFVNKTLFIKINGFKNIPLMEDIEISKSLKKFGRPICLPDKVVTSSRRWETEGYLKTVLLMWKLRLLYFFGVPANHLVKYYYS